MRHPELDYTSPTLFTFRQRIGLAAASWAIATAFKTLHTSCRIEVRGREHADAAHAEFGRVIIGSWHEAIGAGIHSYAHRGYHTLTSYSYDGELAARVSGHFGIPALRGSSSRGGLKALRAMERALNIVPGVIITLDGPRGPRRVAHPGAAILAVRTGTPVITLAVAAQRAWRLGSWDRSWVPMPFSKILVTHSPPLLPPEKRAAGAIESFRQQIETTLNTLQRETEESVGYQEQN